MCLNRNLRTSSIFFFFNDTATTEIYTLSLHDALPISHRYPFLLVDRILEMDAERVVGIKNVTVNRSEEHTSELQSRLHLVCRLLLEKKKKKMSTYNDADVAFDGCKSRTCVCSDLGSTG